MKDGGCRRHLCDKVRKVAGLNYSPEYYFSFEKNGEHDDVIMWFLKNGGGYHDTLRMSREDVCYMDKETKEAILCFVDTNRKVSENE